MSQNRHWLMSRWCWIIGANYNPRAPHYAKYHEFGCEWQRGEFQDFVEYIETHLGPPPPNKPLLSRKNQRLGWIKGNLKWREQRELTRLGRSATMIKYKNKTQSISAWAEEYGLEYSCLFSRLERGWTIKQAVEQ